MNEFPRLFSFARNNKNEFPNIHDNFYTPISEQANMELQQLNMLMEQTQTTSQDNCYI
jgi:hypothetical protein